jgi:hypothetical protein
LATTAWSKKAVVLKMKGAGGVMTERVIMGRRLKSLQTQKKKIVESYIESGNRDMKKELEAFEGVKM